MAGLLEGKVALITGAARGQGREEARRFAQEGADIIALDLCRTPATTTYPGSNSEDLAQTVALVEAEGRSIVAAECDIRDFAELSKHVEAGVSELGHLDIVVGNAGISSTGMSWEITLEQWHETIDTNLTGAFHTAKATVPILLEQGTGGSIVFTSSVAGLKGLPFFAHYSASKHGLVGLARSMAAELGQHNIRVNTIHPFGVEGTMAAPELKPLLERYAETLAPILMTSLPFERSQPADIANAVVWLVSDLARHVTGVALPIDLGTLIR